MEVAPNQTKIFKGIINAKWEVEENNTKKIKIINYALIFKINIYNNKAWKPKRPKS